MLRYKEEKEAFDRYFLSAQEKGGEVYLGNGAALVVYKEDKSAGIQVMESLAGLPSMVFCGYGDMYLMSSEFIRDFSLVSKPENRTGIQPQLTDIIKRMYRQCALWHEGEDVLSLLEDYSEPSFEF